MGPWPPACSYIPPPSWVPNGKTSSEGRVLAATPCDISHTHSFPHSCTQDPNITGATTFAKNRISHSDPYMSPGLLLIQKWDKRAAEKQGVGNLVDSDLRLLRKKGKRKPLSMPLPHYTFQSCPKYDLLIPKTFIYYCLWMDGYVM